MRYFELFDDMSSPGRWHLGDVSALPPPTPKFFKDSPVALSLPVKLTIPITQEGKPLEYCLTSFSVPVGRRDLVELIASIDPLGIQVLPVEIDNSVLTTEFAIPYFLRSLECMDELNSEFTKWTATDHSPELAGRYRMVIKLRIDPAKVPFDAHCFRVVGWPVAYIVSEVVKNAMEARGCTGAVFSPVGGGRSH